MLYSEWRIAVPGFWGPLGWRGAEFVIPIVSIGFGIIHLSLSNLSFTPFITVMESFFEVKGAF